MNDLPLPETDHPAHPSSVGALPYASLLAMRQAHHYLLRRFRQEGATDRFAHTALDFVMQGSATGQIIDTEDDRWAAQTMIDYWAHMLYRWGYEGFDAELDDYDFTYSPELSDDQYPYLGLSAFTELEQGQFIGRRQLVEKALDILRRQRCLAVLGPSGSGKSSFILAGVLPQLKRGELPSYSAKNAPDDQTIPHSNTWHYLPSVEPGENPLQRLAQALRPENAADQWVADVTSRLRNDSQTLLRLLNERVAQQPLTDTAVLFIDEFEEVFTVCQDVILRQKFIENLTHVLVDSQTNHVLLVTIHSDYEALCADWPQLKQQLMNEAIRMTPPTTAELREIITKPAERIGLKFEEGLVDQLLRDVSGEQTALPLLQFTLWRLWQHRDRDYITWDAYNRVGNGRSSLVTAANDFYRQLSPDERNIVRRLFLRFAVPTETGSVEVVRVARSDLYLAGEKREQVENLLTRLVATRLIRVTPKETPADDKFDLVHAALAQDWALYVEWIDTERKVRHERLRLRTAAQQWRDSGREDSRLRRGKLLQASLAYLGAPDLTDLERAFLEASQAAEKEHQQQERVLLERLLATEQVARARLQALAIVLAILTIGAIAVSIWAYQQAVRAQAAEARAVEALAEAEAQADAAQQSQSAAFAAFEDAQEQAQVAREQANIAATAQARAEQNERNSRTQARLALSRRIAAQAFDLSQEQTDLALLLTLEALRVADTVEARSTLINILQSVNQQTTLVRRQQLTGQPDGAFSAVFNPQNGLIASGGYDNSIILYDAVTGQPVGQPLLAHTNRVRRVAFDEQGTLFASASDDTDVILWDVSARPPSLLTTLSGHRDVVNDVLFIPEENPRVGRFLATASRDETIVLWEITNPERPVRLSTPQGGHIDAVLALAVTPNGRTLISAGADQRILLWDISNPGRPSRPFRALTGHAAAINALALSADGRLLASGDDSGQIILWDVRTGQQLGTLTGHTNWILGLDFDPTGRYLASASRDETIILWDVETQMRLSGPFTLHEDWVWQVQFDATGTTLVSAGRDGLVIIWDVETTPPQFSQQVVQTELPVLDVYLTDNQTVQLLTRETLAEWAADVPGDMPQLQRLLNFEETPSEQLTITADGHMAATVISQTLLLWDIEEGTTEATILGEHTNPIRALRFSHDGRWLASTSCAPAPTLPTAENASTITEEVDESTSCQSAEVRLWDVIAQTQTGPTTIITGTELIALAFSPDDTLLAAGGCRYQLSSPTPETANRESCLVGTALLWSVADGALGSSRQFTASTPEQRQGDFVRALALNADNTRLATGSDDSTLQVWDVETGEPLSTPRSAHQGEFSEMLFSPDGQLLISVGHDGRLLLWDPTVPQQLGADLIGHESVINSASFSPNGRWLATGGADGRVLVWRASEPAWRDMACRLANRNLTEAEWRLYIGEGMVQPTCIE